MPIPPLVPVPQWLPARVPAAEPIAGRAAVLLSLDPERHGPDLYRLFDDGQWEHLPYGPFADARAFCSWLAETTRAGDTLLYVLCAAGSERPLGFFGYRQIQRDHGLIEIGHVNFSAALRRSRLASEGLYLLLNAAFDHGFRRCEWRCDSRNLPSAAAARRLGFQFEGTLRQAMVVKGRNRDTMVFSMLDGEWGRLQPAYRAYLDDANFRPDGGQLRALADFLREAGGA
ncbi:GNAT family N-acetyltransferase [Chromobacterium sp. ATCC 53434]|uniref:GNAT family N-acetyltransferase n=1 Tax=Chromobacterium sp. (strain ATCC 53434 / SC 14030) TaxID=2059672 RepID=UPI00130526F1|nr:GNAT family protein [Chromobacterium sp. ATCC 53434]